MEIVTQMSDVVDKWGSAVAERGFAQVPNYLLLLNQFVAEEQHLTPVELLVLIQLVGAWWQKDNLPFPSVTTLALRTGASPRQVQRALKRLEDDGLVARKPRRSRGLISSNAYDLAPLVEVLSNAAKAYPNAFPRKVRAPLLAKKAVAALPSSGVMALEPPKSKKKVVRITRKT